MMSLDLEELLLLIKNGNAHAFRELYNRYKESVFLMVYRRVKDEEESKDIVQEIFLKLWLGKENLVELDNLDYYLFGTARNNVISHYRKKEVQLKGESSLITQLEYLESSADQDILMDELNTKIQEVVDRLPPTMKVCYHLSRAEGKKIKEIASSLNLSEQTVRNNISEALRRLRLGLNHSYPEFLLLAVFLSVRR
jgi:RNA polymerase sigma-70 factor (ECF subfamily)